MGGRRSGEIRENENKTKKNLMDVISDVLERHVLVEKFLDKLVAWNRGVYAIVGRHLRKQFLVFVLFLYFFLATCYSREDHYLRKET